ncbi:MAG: hypothetical protein ACKPKO_64940, partial [Candidatus Fonsibacter sp.]
MTISRRLPELLLSRRVCLHKYTVCKINCIENTIIGDCIPKQINLKQINLNCIRNVLVSEPKNRNKHA